MQTTWLPSGLTSVLEWVMSVNPLAETASASVGQWSPDAWADAGASEAVPVGCEADGCGADDCAAADDAALDDAEATEGPPPLPWQPASTFRLAGVLLVSDIRFRRSVERLARLTCCASPAPPWYACWRPARSRSRSRTATAGSAWMTCWSTAGGSGPRQRTAAEVALADMIADTERLGLYDADPEDVRAALRAARNKPEG